MTYLRRSEGLLAAHALLVDIALHPDRTSAERVGTVLKLTKYPVVLATMVAEVFDQVRIMPDITDDIALVSGEDAGFDYGEALYQINQMRERSGAAPLPVLFPGEVSNVIYMRDYLHLRRSAA